MLFFNENYVYIHKGEWGGGWKKDLLDFLDAYHLIGEKSEGHEIIRIACVHKILRKKFDRT